MATVQAFPCPETGCDKSYPTKKGLATHKSRAHQTKIPSFICQERGCGRAYQTQSALTCHLNQKHSGGGNQSGDDQPNDENPEMLQCDVENCFEADGGLGEGFQDKRALHMHLAHMHNIWRCRSKGCGYEFPDSDKLRIHRDDVHGGGASFGSSNSGGGFVMESIEVDDSTTAKPSTSRRAKQQRKNRNDDIDEEVQGSEGEVGDIVFVCLEAGCGFMHENKEAIRQHRELHEDAAFDQHMATAGAEHDHPDVPIVRTNQNQSLDDSEHGRSSMGGSAYGDFRASTASMMGVGMSSSGNSGFETHTHGRTFMSMSATKDMMKHPLLPSKKGADAPFSASIASNRDAALHPSSPAGRNVATPARSENAAPRPLGARGFAKMALFNHRDEDPQPIRRALPTEKELRRMRFSDEVDNEESEPDHGDGDSGSEYGTQSDSDDQESHEERPKKRTRTSGAAHPDESDTDMSTGVSATPVTTVSRRRVLPPLSKTALFHATYNNPYSSMLSLYQLTAAGFRNDLLLGGVPASAERQYEIDGHQPRGRINDDTDFDTGLAFPRPKAKQSAMANKMRLQTYEFVKARQTKPNDVRMCFSDAIDVPDLAVAQAAQDPVLAGVQGRDVGTGTAAGAVAGAKNARVGKNGKIKKLGSRSKLGPVREKRPYVWKDKEKQKKKAAAHAARLAAAAAAAAGVVAVGEGSGANAVPVASRPRASRVSGGASRR